MSEQRYVFGGTPDALERERLCIVEQVLDPATTQLMTALGVAEGWSCLEIGAGVGSIARWLAQRVGDQGSVVATDIDVRFLTELDLPNLVVRKHDILSDALESEHYDLVHCRVVLTHLAEPEQALIRMADAVSRGGLLFLEEPDSFSWTAADLNHPFAERFNRLAQATTDLIRRARVHVYMGRTLRRLVESLGWESFGHEGTTAVVRGGEPSARQWQIIVETFGEVFVQAGAWTEQDREDLHRIFGDPSFSYIEVSMFRAWARKPR